MEDTLFAGAVMDRIGSHFTVSCDSSHFAQNLYRMAANDMFGFMQDNDATHYHRLMNFGLEKDIRYCLTPDLAQVLPLFHGDRLIASKD
jgi:2-phosphosulfolactate phosphatase